MNKVKSLLNFFWLLSIVACCSSMQAHVLIFTHAFNRPDFIEIQYKTFKKFFLDDYEFVVFNDAIDPHFKQLIEEMCNKYGIRCIRIPQEIHELPYLPRTAGEEYQNPSCRASNAIQYSLDTLVFDHDDIAIMIDSDMFFVKPFNAHEYLQGYSLSGVKQGIKHVTFLFTGLIFFDMRTLPNKRTMNFNCGMVDGLRFDGGGHVHYYLKNNPEVKIRYIKNYYSGRLQCDPCNNENRSGCSHNSSILQEIDFDKNQIAFLQTDNNLEFLLDNTILHYRSASNWNNKDALYHQRKTENLNRYLATILEA